MKTIELSEFQLQKTRSIALLIDDENISSEFADKIVDRAGRSDELTVKRVYGNAAATPGWDKAPGIRLIHTGAGKNSADMMLVIQAVELAMEGEITTFAIVSSDGDFSHLAHFLPEKGFQVIGIGEAKAPDNFRKVCTSFHELSLPKVAPNPCTAKITLPTGQKKSINQMVEALIDEDQNPKGLLISSLNVNMHRQHSIKISEQPEKNWRTFLTARPDIFSCDPKGPNARVRLK